MAGSSTASGLLPVLESFAVLRVTGSAARLGVLLAAQGAVSLLLSLAGGVAGDRFPRGRVLIAAVAARLAAAVTLTVTFLAHTATFGVLLGMAVVYGAADGVSTPVSTALLPDVVPAARLAAANALIGSISSGAAVAAPALAGVLVATLGPGAGFACESAVLAVPPAACALPGRRASPHIKSGVLGQLRAGWRVFARLRWLCLLTMQGTVFSFLVLAPVAVLGPAIAARYLGGPATWGLISSALMLGAVAGQLAAGRIRCARPALLCACVSPAGVAEALALGLGAPVAVIGVAAAAAGVALGISSVVLATSMQTAVPAPVLARVAAFDLIGSEIGQPAGYAIAGSVGVALGLHAFLVAAAAAAFAVMAVLAVRLAALTPPPS